LNKCCIGYGKEITEMINDKLMKILIESKDDKKLLRGLNKLIFELTGNINFAQRMNILLLNRGK
jgi:hypothetical protein